MLLIDADSVFLWMVVIAAVLPADELARLMEGVGLPQVSISGMFLNPVTSRWSLMNDTSVNYISFFKKKTVS